VSGIAAEVLPPEIPAFVRTPAAVADIAVFGRELDRSKGAGPTHDSERDAGHFVALADDGSIAGVMPLEEIPLTREAYDTALRKKGFDQYRAGLPAARDRRRMAAAREGLRLLARCVSGRPHRRHGRRPRLVRCGPPPT
jgi:hypothetical protein